MLLRWRGLLTIVSVSALSGCELSRFGMPESISKQGDDVLQLWRGAVVAAIAVAVLVWVLVLTAVVRFRRRGDAPGDGDIPSQRADNRVLEALYTAVPVVVVLALFGFTLATLHNVDRVRGDPDLEVEVVGFQWQWQFHYPDLGITITGDDPNQPPELVLPVGRTVLLHLRAADVIHSLWVPELLTKRDLFPDVDNQIVVDLTTPGVYVGRCAEFCGLDHFAMTFAVRAVTADEFDAWAASTARSP